MTRELTPMKNCLQFQVHRTVNITTGSMFLSLCSLRDLSFYCSSCPFSAGPLHLSELLRLTFPQLFWLLSRCSGELHPCSMSKSSHPCLSSAFCSGPKPEGPNCFSLNSVLLPRAQNWTLLLRPLRVKMFTYIHTHMHKHLS